MAARLITAVLQARMGSSRLPGKALLPISGEKGSLEIMLERVSASRSCVNPIVATTTLSEDDPIEALCARLGLRCFRGHPTDVLDRYYRCAEFFGAKDVVVRLTGDCPLHDPAVIDRVVRFFLAGSFDYASNSHPPTFPDGLDTEVFTFAALERAWKEGRAPAEREHVTYGIYTRPRGFRVGNLENGKDLSGLRWTLDEPRDMAFVRAVYAELGGAGAFGMQDVLDLLRARPELAALNSGIVRNEGLLKTLAAGSP